jgi:hypothetical protein
MAMRPESKRPLRSSRENGRYSNGTADTDSPRKSKSCPRLEAISFSLFFSPMAEECQKKNECKKQNCDNPALGNTSPDIDLLR